MTTRKSDTLQAEEEVYVTSDASPATSWTREVRPRLQPAARAELLQARSEADEALGQQHIHPTHTGKQGSTRN